MITLISNSKAISTPRTAHHSRRTSTNRDAAPSLAIGVLPLSILPLLAIALTWPAPGWVLMWTTAFVLYVGFKWLTWWDAGDARRKATRCRNVTYLLAWPGMDARAFLRSADQSSPAASEWIWPVVNIVTGAALLWFATPRLLPDYPLTAGWSGMIGIVLILHFGVFGLQSCAWRAAGIDAPRQFHLPIASISLDDFWSRRWNRAFRDLSRTYVLLPVMRRINVAAGVMAVFLISGLLHELVISLPARAGWGLPTAYFCAQGAGILIANSSFGRRTGLNRGIAGRAWMLLFVGGPAYFLFHPMFVTKVMLPFLDAIGAA